ncbi:MAG: GDP-mannose 4,6-dehydratase, partial [Caldilineaceae bacterium]|nr:GDP-mannose 4,6-dehydratase [Caldilineaceae bacterium]
FYQASSSEMFGKVRETPQTEATPFYPRSPYGCAKVFGHDITVNYRESYGLFAASGILFNHESPRRSLHFVTRKITVAVACIKNRVKIPPLNELGEPLVSPAGKLKLGWLESQRDWGYAPEYVDAMWRMLQNDTPQDYVIGTGVSHTVADVCRIAFAHVGLDWQDHVVTDEQLLRPTEIETLVGDYRLAQQELNWQPQTSFAELIGLMVDADLDRFH